MRRQCLHVFARRVLVEPAGLDMSSSEGAVFRWTQEKTRLLERRPAQLEFIVADGQLHRLASL